MTLEEAQLSLLPRYAFGDVDRSKLDIVRHKIFIISRLFERRKFDDVITIIIFYGKDETGRVLLDNRYLTREGVFLAYALLGLPLKDFKAFATRERNE